ncbi:hypothetical protein HNP38_001094 [Chryseobacterium defluvii]|uniref:Uncharacterized protein n=1 Tax=Chryseobacterium defluvii TaxID=160396 RepID=A0A840KFV6_9FLAO|nr:hypothetical protein [Chryseobacterium defluvii]MBB4805822.1 hypothetical protein [Chryseobacterium defluvii]
MRKFILAALLISNFAWAQSAFFDENDNAITKEQFHGRKLKNGELKVYNDSLKTTKILSERSESGEIGSGKIIDQLNASLGLKLKEDRPVIIIYHPGKDRCNSTGTSTPESAFLWFKELEKKANKIQKSEFIHIYKDKKGVKTINKIKWHKDPRNIIENTFFKYHYPCSSYVILYKNKYTSYFGEFPPDYILRDLEAITP